MSDNTSEIFKNLQTDFEKNQLLKSMIQSRATISCKSVNESITKVIVNDIDDDEKEITTNLSPGEKAPEFTNQEVTCHLFLNHENYYFKTHLYRVSATWRLRVPEKIFHLQRRQNFRVRFPESNGSYFELQNINGKKINVKLKLKDLSIGGLGLSIKKGQVDLLEGQEIHGILRVMRKDPIEIFAIVRHLKFGKNNEADQVFVGAQFNSKMANLERTLFGLTLELYRDLHGSIKFE